MTATDNMPMTLDALRTYASDTLERNARGDIAAEYAYEHLAGLVLTAHPDYPGLDRPRAAVLYFAGEYTFLLLHRDNTEAEVAELERLTDAEARAFAAFVKAHPLFDRARSGDVRTCPVAEA